MQNLTEDVIKCTRVSIFVYVFSNTYVYPSDYVNID